MTTNATYRLLLDTATGETFNFNSSGEAFGIGGNSQSTFRPATIDISRNLSSKSITLTLPRLSDSYARLSSILLNDSISADIRARYSMFIDGAERILLYGRVSRTSYTDSSMQITVTSYLENLKYGKTFKVSNSCQNNFGNLRCGFDLSTVTFTNTIDTIADDRLSFTLTTPVTALQFQDGLLLLDFTADGGREVSVDLAVNDENTVYLWEQLPRLLVNPGDPISLQQGCLRTEGACRGYNNFINFGGVPTAAGFSPTTLQIISGARN